MVSVWVQNVFTANSLNIIHTFSLAQARSIRLRSLNLRYMYIKTWVVYHFKKIPVSSVGKFGTGRIVYHLQNIPIMENVIHFFTQSASVAPGHEN